MTINGYQYTQLKVIMKKFIMSLFILIISLQIGKSELLAFYYGESGPPGPNEVHIGQTAIEMPRDRILLVRRQSDYCAIKFTKFWTGKTEEDLFAAVESYYPNKKNGYFSGKNVEVRKEELSSPKAGWSLFGHPFAIGLKEKIQCGPFTLWWIGRGAVYFFERSQTQGDHGMEFAPTKWTDISEVNVFDPSLKWYRYDESRQRINIPIDKLWEDARQEKQK